MSKAKFVIDGIIGEPDPMLLSFGVTENTTSSIDVHNFLLANSEAEVIEIEIRSNGGSVSQGFDIYDQLKNSGKKIITKGYRVNSIATVIFLAGDERYLSRNAEFIIHNPYIGAEALSGLTLTADVLEGISADVKATEEKIFNFYSTKLKLNDSDKIKLRSLMDKDTDVGAEAAIDLGFANGYLEQMNKRAAYTDLIVANYKLKSNNNLKMNAEVKEQLNGLEKLVNKVLNLLPNKPKMKNETSNLIDGTAIYYDGALEVGVQCFLDESLTMPLDDGSYPMEDGRTLIVTDGFVSEITESDDASNPEIDALKAKITELEGKLNDSETKKTELQNNNLEIAKEVKELQFEINNFKKIVIGAENKKIKKAEVVTDDMPEWKKILINKRNKRS